MNTTELFQQLFNAVSRKFYELQGKLYISIFIESNWDKSKAIVKANDLVNEYNKTRNKIKKQLNYNNDQSESPVKQGNCTSRVDTMLSDKLYTIINEVHELCKDHPLEFKVILDVIKQLKIRRKKKKFKDMKSHIKSSHLKNVSINDSDTKVSNILSKKK